MQSFHYIVLLIAVIVVIDMVIDYDAWLSKAC